MKTELIKPAKCGYCDKRLLNRHGAYVHISKMHKDEYYEHKSLRASDTNYGAAVWLRKTIK